MQTIGYAIVLLWQSKVEV